jgi:UDP-GlcNAc:undecaprenyl-phosphate GlcNAc-1-phosphate transferase
VPFLDTTFVLLKRVKYKQPVYRPDSEHFHHRMARIGYSRRGTIGFLYAWTLMLAGVALALRFVPYSDHHGHLYTGWTIVMVTLGVVAIAASVYLVYVLEILKFRRLSEMRLRRLRPDASPAEIEAGVAKDFETGEFQAIAEVGEGVDEVPTHLPPGENVPRAQQRISQRQVDQDGVGADRQRAGHEAPVAADGG